MTMWRYGPALALGAAVLTTGLLACSDKDDEADPAADPPAPAEWTSLGRDLGHSRAATDETTVDAGNVTSLAPAWERDGIKGLTGTPLVVDGVVYIGDWTGHVRALDATTGEEQWATDVDTFYIGGSVAVDDERVYVGAFDTRVIALDRATGDELWTTKVSDHSQAAVFGSPIVVDGTVYLGVASFELMTGSLEPEFRGSVVALDAATGEETWRYWTVDETEAGIAGVAVWGTPSIDLDRGHLYIGTGNSYGPQPSPRSDAVIALDLATGKELWVTQFTEGDVWTTANPQGVDADVGAPVNFFTVDGTDALGVADKAGIYHALSREDGKVLWEAELTTSLADNPRNCAARAMMSPTRCRGLSEPYGSWKIIWMRRRFAASAEPRRARKSVSPTHTWPLSLSTRRIAAFTNVLLPEPDSPTIARVLPRGSCSETLRKAATELPPTV